MTDLVSDALLNPDVRRAFEEELLVAEATDTLEAYMESVGLSRKELARRLGVSPGRVTQILSGSQNLTLRSLAGAAWAMGLRLQLEPAATDRAGTPAQDDPPPPAWISRLRRSPEVMWRVPVPRVQPQVPNVPTVIVDQRGVRSHSPELAA